MTVPGRILARPGTGDKVMLQDVAPQVLVAGDLADALTHHRSVDHDVLGGIVRERKQDVLAGWSSQCEAARADVLSCSLTLAVRATSRTPSG